MTIIKAERTYTVIKFGKRKTERLFGKLKMIFKLFNVSYSFVVLERDKWYKFSFVMISLVNHKAFGGTYEGITTFYCKELAIALELENNSHNCKLHL